MLGLAASRENKTHLLDMSSGLSSCASEKVSLFRLELGWRREVAFINQQSIKQARAKDSFKAKRIIGDPQLLSVIPCNISVLNKRRT